MTSSVYLPPPAGCHVLPPLKSGQDWDSPNPSPHKDQITFDLFSCPPSSHCQEVSISFPQICWVHTSKNSYSWVFSKSSILGVNPLPSILQDPALPKPNHCKVFFQSASTRTPTTFHVLPRKQMFSSMSSLLGCLATTGCFPPLLQFWPLLEERAPRRAGLLAPSSSPVKAPHSTARCCCICPTFKLNWEFFFQKIWNLGHSLCFRKNTKMAQTFILLV